MGIWAKFRPRVVKSDHVTLKIGHKANARTKKCEIISIKCVLSLQTVVLIGSL